MKILPTNFEEAKLLVPDVYEDHRGYFKETYQLKKHIDAGLYQHWVQDAVSFTSNKNTIRGLHWQPNMAKLVNVLSGKVYDVIVDVRKDSSTYMEWQGFYLSSDNHCQLFVPAGFAHGFLSLTDNVVFHYKMSEFHNKNTEKALYYATEDIGISWPIISRDVIISEKDNSANRNL